MNDNSKTAKKLTGSIIAVVVLALCLCITTFALVWATVSVDNNLFHTGTVKINLNDGKPVIEEHEFLFEPGMTVKKDFFIENESTCDVYYKLYFDNVNGGLADVLQITVKDGDRTLYQGTAAELNRTEVTAADDVLKIKERRELTVYFCTGTDKEKLDWFRVINIAGEKLLDQELLNAVYVGPFVTDARRHFSKDGCPAYKIAADLLNGVAREQAYLHTVLQWAARREGIKEVSEYMSKHKDDANANQLWAYFSAIVTWVRSTFIKYRKEMKGLNCGLLYDTYHEQIYDTTELEKRIHDLMEDDEIMKKSGIYSYVLSGDLRDLSFRTFDMSDGVFIPAILGVTPTTFVHLDPETGEITIKAPTKITIEAPAIELKGALQMGNSTGSGTGDTMKITGNLDVTGSVKTDGNVTAGHFYGPVN